MHGIHLNVMAVTALMVAQAASTPVHCELCFTCKIYLHGNLYNTTNYECVYIEFDNLNCNSSFNCTGKMLRGNKVLTSLQLHDCGIGPEGLSELCSALEVNTTLTKLDLSYNTFDDHSLASLGKVLIITVAVMTESE